MPKRIPLARAPARRALERASPLGVGPKEPREERERAQAELKRIAECSCLAASGGGSSSHGQRASAAAHGYGAPGLASLPLFPSVERERELHFVGSASAGAAACNECKPSTVDAAAAGAAVERALQVGRGGGGGGGGEGEVAKNGLAVSIHTLTNAAPEQAEELLRCALDGGFFFSPPSSIWTWGNTKLTSPVR